MKWYQRMNPFFKNEASNMSNAGRWLADLLTMGYVSHTGKEVSVQTAITNTAVSAAVRLIAETIATLPLHVYERTGEDGKKKCREHPLYPILHNSPNEEMTAFSFWEMALYQLLLADGNFYAEIERNNAQEVIALWPLLPNKMDVRRIDGVITYVYQLPNGVKTPLPSSKVFHLHGLSGNGLKGITPLEMAKEAVGLSLAAEEYGARFFGNGANVNGVLESDAVLGEVGRKNLRQSFDETYGGLSKAHRLLILEEGMKYKATGMPPDAAQFLETRKFQIAEIARLFRVPPHMIYDLDRATFSNIEQQSLEFVKYTILPWLTRIEQTVLWKLLTRVEKQKYFAEFSLEGLLRGDIKSRFEALHIARLDGIITDDEWRAMENWNPLTPEQRKLVYRPVNMVYGDTPVPDPNATPPAADPSKTNPDTVKPKKGGE